MSYLLLNNRFGVPYAGGMFYFCLRRSSIFECTSHICEYSVSMPLIISYHRMLQSSFLCVASSVYEKNAHAVFCLVQSLCEIVRVTC